MVNSVADIFRGVKKPGLNIWCPANKLAYPGFGITLLIPKSGFRKEIRHVVMVHISERLSVKRKKCDVAGTQRFTPA